MPAHANSIAWKCFSLASGDSKCSIAFHSSWITLRENGSPALRRPLGTPVDFSRSLRLSESRMIYGQTRRNEHQTMHFKQASLRVVDNNVL